MSAGNHTLTLRPSTRKTRRGLIRTAVVTAVLTVGAGIFSGTVAAVAVGLVGLAALGVYGGMLAVSRIEVSGAEIAVRGLLMRRRRSRADAAEVVRADLAAPLGPRKISTVFVLDHAGRRLLRVNGRHYSRADLDLLVHTLHLPCGGPPTPVTPRQLHRYRSGLVSLFERQPMTVGFVAAKLLVGLALVTIILVDSMVG